MTLAQATFAPETSEQFSRALAEAETKKINAAYRHALVCLPQLAPESCAA